MAVKISFFTDVNRIQLATFFKLLPKLPEIAFFEPAKRAKNFRLRRKPLGQNVVQTLSVTEVQEVHGYNFSTEITAEDFLEYSIRTSKSTLSINEKAISFRVADLQRSYGFCSKQQLLGCHYSAVCFGAVEDL